MAPNRSVRRRLVAALMALAAVAAACGGGGGTSTPSEQQQDVDPIPGGTLRVGLGSETGGYNPTVDQWGLSGYMVAQAVFDRLFAYDAEGVLRPYLAESAENSDDFMVWTIRLRPDVLFHNDTPFDGDALKRNLDGHIANPILGQVMSAIDEVNVIDALTVEVVMNRPWSSFPHTLTAQPGFVVAPEMLDDPDGSRNPIGTGPFRFLRWEQDKEFVVEKNDDYWRPGYPLLDGIEFRILADDTARAAALRSGELELMETRHAADIVDFESDDTDEFLVYLDVEGETTEEVFFLNVGSPPFDDPIAREAVVSAIDKDELSEVVFAGRFPPATGPFKESSPWYQEIDYPAYDVERARALAAEYEQKYGEQLSFEFMTVSDVTASRVAQLIQGQMVEAGIEMEIRQGEAVALLLDGLYGNFQSGSINALWGSGHPDREYTFLHGDNANPEGEPATAFTRMRSDEVDAGLEEARATDDLVAQSEAWGRVQQGIADEMSFTFLVHDDIGDVAHIDVHDVVEWTFPDGTVGLGQEQTVLSLYQVWINR